MHFRRLGVANDYLAGESLYFQQGYELAQKLWVESLAIDSDFPSALNMLGYIHAEAHDQDPQKAIDYVSRFNPGNWLDPATPLIGRSASHDR